jgi:alpha-L-rhamnosidase
MASWGVSQNSATGQENLDEMERVFMNPPDSAKPRVWWHWISGNIIKEGIRLDLDG